MQFYMCKPARGPVQLAATQIDAKAIDKGFELVELRDDKAGRIEFINALYAQAYTVPQPGLDEINAATPKSDLMQEAGEALGVETLNIAIPRVGLPKDYRGHPADCPGCLRSAQAAKIMGGIEMRDAIDEAIDISDADEIARLQALLDARRIALTPVHPVAPAPRKRPA